MEKVIYDIYDTTGQLDSHTLEIRSRSYADGNVEWGAVIHDPEGKPTTYRTSGFASLGGCTAAFMRHRGSCELEFKGVPADRFDLADESALDEFLDAFGSCGEVVIFCYVAQVWRSAADAFAFFKRGITHSEGPERDRYMNVFAGLLDGKRVIDDGHTATVSKVPFLWR